MKKILLLILLLLPVGICATDTYDPTPIAVFEDNSTDIVNGYVLTPVSTGGVWEHTTLTPKFGTDYYHTVLGGKWDLIPLSVEQALAAASAWTIQWYGWLPTKSAVGAGKSSMWFFGRGTNGSAGDLAIWLLEDTTWNPWGTDMSGWIGGAQFYAGTFSATLYPDGAVGNRWCRFNICYDGNYKKFYMDGTLIWTSAASQANLFSYTTDDNTFRTSSQFGNDYGGYWAKGMDRIICAPWDSGGAEIGPFVGSPTFTPTFTVTPTITETSTFTFTPTFTITPTFTVTPIICAWSELTNNAAWSPRQFAGYTVFNDAMYILGGAALDNVTVPQKNDVWYSTNGADWLPATQNAAWSPRRRLTSIIYDNKMWVIGGINQYGIYQKDVWYSANGIDWTCATGNAAWGDPANFSSGSGRITQGFLSYNGYMWVITGQVQGVGPVNDVWRSTDGIDWEAVTRNADFAGRSGFAAWVYNNYMWIAGGAGSAGAQVNNAWYSDNGITWTNAGTIAYTKGMWEHLGSAIFLNHMWLLFGEWANPGQSENTVVWDDTGATWHDNTYAYGSGGYAPRGAGGALTYHGQIFILGGVANEDAYITPTPVATIAPLNDVWVSFLCGPTFTPTFTPTPSISPTYTVTETSTDTVTETHTDTVTPTVTKTVTETVTPTTTPTFTNTPSPTFTITATPTFTKTIRSTNTPTVTKTYTPTITWTVTKTITPTITVTKIVTPRATNTPATVTPTITRTCCPIFHINTFTPTITPAHTYGFNIVVVVQTYIYGLKPTPPPTFTATVTATP